MTRMRHAVVGLAVLLSVGVATGTGPVAVAATAPNPAPGVQPEPPRPAPIRLAQRAAPGQGYCYDSTLRLFYEQTDYAPECATGDTEITKQQFDQKSVTAAPSAAPARTADRSPAPPPATGYCYDYGGRLFYRLTADVPECAQGDIQATQSEFNRRRIDPSSGIVRAFCLAPRINHFYEKTTTGSGCGVDRQITRAEYQRRELTRADRQNAAAQTYCHDARIGLFYAMTTSGGCGDDAEITKAEYDRKQLNGGSSQQASALGYCYDPRLRLFYTQTRDAPACATSDQEITKAEFDRKEVNTTQQASVGLVYCYDAKSNLFYTNDRSEDCGDDRRLTKLEYDRRQVVATLPGRPRSGQTYCYSARNHFFYRRASPGPCSPHREITAAEYHRKELADAPRQTAAVGSTYCHDPRLNVYYEQTAAGRGCAPNDREVSQAQYESRTRTGATDRRSYCLTPRTQAVYRSHGQCARNDVSISEREYEEKLGRAERVRILKDYGSDDRARRAEAALADERRRRRALEEQVARLERERGQESQPRTRPDGADGISGTGILVNRRGVVLTNAHVVADCTRITVRFVGQGTFAAEVMTRSSNSDLALLSTKARGRAATFRAPSRKVQMGEEVLAFGFPLSGFLSSQGNLTRGDISATTGIRDDIRFLQISAPVQPGNSGGPLMDVAGNVVGVVTAKADATKIAEVTGDIPQNVNFAITGTIAMDFLRAHRVTFDTTNDARDVGAPRIAELAQGFAPYIECWQ